jgi:hypothetical protein
MRISFEMPPEKLSTKTDTIVERTINSFSSDKECSFSCENKSHIRNSSLFDTELSSLKKTAEYCAKLEEDLKEKNAMVKELQSVNKELKTLIRQLQEEK